LEKPIVGGGNAKGKLSFLLSRSNSRPGPTVGGLATPKPLRIRRLPIAAASAAPKSNLMHRIREMPH
jgi:hypothetical protein